MIVIYDLWQNCTPAQKLTSWQNWRKKKKAHKSQASVPAEQLAPPKNDVSLFELLFEVGNILFSILYLVNLGCLRLSFVSAETKYMQKNFPWSKTVTEFVNIRIWLFGVKKSAASHFVPEDAYSFLVSWAKFVIFCGSWHEALSAFLWVATIVIETLVGANYNRGEGTKKNLFSLLSEKCLGGVATDFSFPLPESRRRRSSFSPWGSFPNRSGGIRNLGNTPSSRRSLFSSSTQKVPVFCAILPCLQRRNFYGRVSEVNLLLEFFSIHSTRAKTVFLWVNSAFPHL